MIGFFQYPRFVVFDKLQNIYLVRADATQQRVSRLGKTNHLRHGLMLPANDSFLWVRGSEHQDLRAEICALSFTGEPAVRARPSGIVPRKYDPRREGAAVRGFDELEGLEGRATCLLLLLRSGWLVRKTL